MDFTKVLSEVRMANFYPLPQIVSAYIVRDDIHGDNADPNIVQVVGIDDELYHIPKARFSRLKVPVGDADWEYVEENFTPAELREWLYQLRQAQRRIEAYTRSIEAGIDRLEHSANG